MIRTTAVLLAAAGITFAASPALAAPAASKDLCKSGGYASYVDPATGAPFKNQGQCVDSVNAGNPLMYERSSSVDYLYYPVEPSTNWNGDIYVRCDEGDLARSFRTQVEGPAVLYSPGLFPASPANGNPTAGAVLEYNNPSLTEGGTVTLTVVCERV